MPDLSTLSDDFPGTSLDTGKWESTGYSSVDISGNQLTWSGPGGTITTVDTYEIGTGASLAVRIHGEDLDRSFSVTVSSSTYTYQIAYNGAGTLSCFYSSPAGSNTVNVDYDLATMLWFHFIEFQPWAGFHVVGLATSSNGVDWSMKTSSGQLEVNDGFHVSIFGLGTVTVGQVVGGIYDPGPPDDPPPDVNPLDVPPYDVSPTPYVPPNIPAVPDASCATLLELAQQFSGQVRRAIRVTGPRRIEMVDAVAPLPDGITQADAPKLYYTATRGLTAGAPALSLNAGALALTSDASFSDNDIQLLVSGWRIPDRLPVHKLHPAPVMRVTYDFSPEQFNASVEFAHHSIPLEVRRT